MERQTNQCDLFWRRESAFRLLGRERGCGQGVWETRAQMTTLPTLQDIRWPLSDGTKGIAAPLSAWNASLQCILVLSAALGGLKFMECKDRIRNLLYTNASSVRTVGALFRYILGTFVTAWMIVDVERTSVLLVLRVHQYFEVVELPSDGLLRM